MKNMFDEALRYDYDLTDEATVFDIGGYKGEFAQNIFNKFGCFVWCFEPVFKIESDNFEVFPFALGGKTRTQSINVDTNKTGMFCKSGSQYSIQVIDVVEFIDKTRYKDSAIAIGKIDLMKINIEGMEYELLDRLINSGYIGIIDNIQVQFHNVTPTSDRDMYLIQQRLKETHHITWQYRYVWENWERNGN